jgi:hypothetical protein
MTGQPTNPNPSTQEQGARTMDAQTRDKRTPSDLLAIAIDANRPVLLMGAPGTAKTATLEAIAAARGAHLEIVIASAQDPTTILGIPMPTEDRKYTEPTMPGWARRINDAHAAGLPTILFLDELTTVPEMVAAPLLGVVQSRRADGWTIPDDTRIVAAANPPDLAVGGWALAPAMANRWVHIEWPSPVAHWLDWARQQPSPALKVIAEYIALAPDELLRVPSGMAARSGAWPSPRSWTNASALIDTAGGDYTLAALCIGDVAAAQFADWAARRDLPSVAEMLDGSRAIPEAPDALRTALQALAAAATPETMDRTVEIMIGAIAIDAAQVAVAARAMVDDGHVAGIAPLVDALTTAGAL